MGWGECEKMSSTSAPTPAKYQPPTPAPLPEDYDEFIASRSERERQLLTLAQEKLASSFVVQWCHMYQQWKKNKNSTSAS